MSNYTITTNFGAKDSLPSGNAGKVIKGSEFTTEFTNIQTAIATKADTAGDTFTGAVTFDAAVTLNSTATITGDLTVDTDTLFVDVSADKVGIGTTSPDYTLDIEADTAQARIHSTVGNSVLRLDSVDTGESKIYFADNSASAIGTIEYHHNTNHMSFATGATTRMLINSSGNVGIGTTSPSAKATIEDGDFARLDLNLSNATGTTIADIRGLVEGTEKWRIGKTASASDDFTINVGSTERMRIDSSGDMTIGTTSKNSATTLKVENASGYASTLELNQHQQGAASIAVPASENALQFNRFNGTSLEEAMRIDSSGNLLVGTTSPFGGATDDRMTVKNTNLSTGGIRIGNTDGSGNTTCLRFHNSNGIVGSVVTNGSATSFNTSSDERLKENIADSADAGSKVDAIQIRQFDWKADGSHQNYGVIAQELVTVAPEAVYQPEDSEEMMGVDYSKLVPMLIKEIQSLRSRVAELENA